MKGIGISIASLVFLVLVINIPPFKLIWGQDDCKYSNGCGSFTFEEVNFNERNYDMCMYKFQEFKKENYTDTVLYRLCPMKMLHFWRYGDYLFSKKYRLPFKLWEEIKKCRGGVHNRTGFQDF